MGRGHPKRVCIQLGADTAITVQNSLCLEQQWGAIGVWLTPAFLPTSIQYRNCRQKSSTGQAIAPGAANAASITSSV
jgi:hypothetical protein